LCDLVLNIPMTSPTTPAVFAAGFVAVGDVLHRTIKVPGRAFPIHTAETVTAVDWDRVTVDGRHDLTVVDADTSTHPLVLTVGQLLAALGK
jgi:hypothetical protein